ncbi:MAG: twin-arginine translocation protein TatB subunit [Ramlibacter sp.]|nr:twin-arginine translocation protein TatB subunit [Ramlibacter sp.]
MLDLGLSKMALIGVVALIVIGPEKLPRVARTVGTLLGKAQRYVADVKAEVNRSMDLDELKKMTRWRRRRPFPSTSIPRRSGA